MTRKLLLGRKCFSLLPRCERTLQHYLDQSGDVPQHWTELRAVLHGIVDALQCLKHLGIFHRDISPSNIFYCAHGPTGAEYGTEYGAEYGSNYSWVLGDFGRSVEEKEYRGLAADPRRRESLGSGGAGPYLATADVYGRPPLVGTTGTTEATPKVGFQFASDVYSLGKVLARILPLISLTDEEYALLEEVILRMTDDDYLLRPSLSELAAIGKLLL